jgi:uncharacterized membrane protein
MSAPRRLGIVVVIGVGAFFLLEPFFNVRTRLLVAWNAGVIAYLTLAWVVVALTDPTMTRVRAQLYDQSGYVIFVMVVTAASASFVAIGFIVGDFKQLPFWPRAARLSLCVTALLQSWLLIQTLFAFHYARWYYSRPAGEKTPRGGLIFPGDKEPDYLDFAYYAFVVGMTSQTSDVTVASRQMRRVTLIHSVLAFIYNIAILAMSINIIGGVI